LFTHFLPGGLELVYDDPEEDAMDNYEALLVVKRQRMDATSWEEALHGQTSYIYGPMVTSGSVIGPWGRLCSLLETPGGFNLFFFDRRLRGKAVISEVERGGRRPLIPKNAACGIVYAEGCVYVAGFGWLISGSLHLKTGIPLEPGLLRGMGATFSAENPSKAPERSYATPETVAAKVAARRASDESEFEEDF
jgi:hypothetical protein